MDSGQLDELRQLVEAALARYGVAGTLSIDGALATLVGPGRAVSVEVSLLLQRWSTLAFEERKREAQVLAKSLAARRRALGVVAPRRQRSPAVLFSAGFIALAAAVIAVKVPFRSIGAWLTGQSNIAPPRAPSFAELDREREERAQRVCSASLSRVLRGATLGPMDAEGWVVEISLLRDASAGTATPWPSLDGFLDLHGGKEQAQLTWPGSAKLSAARGISTKVSVAERALPEGGPAFFERTLTLWGEYALAYFRERDRIEFVRLAHALAKQSGAHVAALYARCAGLENHQLGAWFAGNNPSGAAAALLYSMGVYAYPPHIHARLLAPRAGSELEPAFALASLLEATKDLNRKQVASLISGQDGMVAEAEGLTSIRFPFVNSSSATRASLALAKNLELVSEQ